MATDGSAKSGKVYKSAKGKVDFGAGEKTKTIKVSVEDAGAFDEGIQDFTIELSGGTGGKVAKHCDTCKVKVMPAETQQKCSLGPDLEYLRAHKTGGEEKAAVSTAVSAGAYAVEKSKVVPPRALPQSSDGLGGQQMVPEPSLRQVQPPKPRMLPNLVQAF